MGDVRYDNVRDIRDYIAADNVRVNAETESLDTQANEYAMLALRLADGVDLVEFFAHATDRISSPTSTAQIACYNKVACKLSAVA